MMDLKEYLKLAPVVRDTPHRYLWSSYDEEADTLYISFKKPSHATDSEVTDDDVIIRHEGEAVGQVRIDVRSQDLVPDNLDQLAVCGGERRV